MTQHDQTGSGGEPTNTLHVSPLGDLIDHDTSTHEPDCVCGPRTEAVKREDGAIDWVIVHNALDGRPTSS